MKQNLPPTPQPLTPAVLLHIADLVEAHNKGLADRCARYRRRTWQMRGAVAACLVAATVWTSAQLYGARMRTFAVGDAPLAYACAEVATMLEGMA